MILNRISNDMIQDPTLALKLDFWKDKVSKGIFVFMAIFSFISIIPALIMAVSEGKYTSVIINSIVYLMTIIIVFRGRTNYIQKGIILLTIFYTLGLYLLFNYGYSSTGNLWLMSLTIISSLLFGKKGIILSISLISATYISFIPLIINSRMSWVLNSEKAVKLWTIHASTYILLSLILSISLTVFITGFSKTLIHLFSAKKATILGLAKLAEHKDTDTGQHILRLKRYSGIIAYYLFRNHNNDGYITREYIEDIKVSSVLHDIGKVGIEDSILQKPGKLTDKEFDKMKTHTTLGGDVISEIEKNIEGRSIYSIGKEIAYYHHEKWDGSGYPNGLKGEKIPLSARIVSIVDVYDALTTKRPYKEAMSHDDAINLITESSGTHFDPLMVEALLMNENEFKKILQR